MCFTASLTGNYADDFDDDSSDDDDDDYDDESEEIEFSDESNSSTCSVEEDLLVSLSRLGLSNFLFNAYLSNI